MQIEWWMGVVGVALAFDFVNGFHDSANAIATVVATRVLSPIKAVLMAGFFNFVGPFVFSLAIADTVAKTIDSSAGTTSIVFAGLMGAIIWDLVTWRWGLPTSSSHALVGGLVGAAIGAAFVEGIASSGYVPYPTSSELLHVGEHAILGAIGGLIVGALLIGWSRIRIPRGLLPLFVVAGVAFMAWFVVGYTSVLDDLREHYAAREMRDILKPAVLGMVFLLLGAIFGALTWAMSQQPMSPRVAPIVALPGACGTLAVATLIGTLKLGAITKVIVFMVVSPILGFFMGFTFYGVLQWMWREKNPADVNRWSSRLQLGSSAFYALTHGTNDAQKTMGVIGLLLFTAGEIGKTPSGTFDIPTWVIFASAGAMGLGTAFGGWRIVKTMASRITQLRPHQGFAAETAGGVVLVAMAESGIPVSTTHAISSSIMGVGATKRKSAVRWGVGRRIVIAWIFTIPASGAVAFVCYLALAQLG